MLSIWRLRILGEGLLSVYEDWAEASRVADIECGSDGVGKGQAFG